MASATPTPVHIFFSAERGLILASVSAASEPVDVTGPVLQACASFIGPGHTLGLKSGGRTVVQISVTLPLPEPSPVNGS